MVRILPSKCLIIFIAFFKNFYSVAAISAVSAVAAFSSNWSGDFNLIDGSNVIKTPERISMGFMSCGSDMSLRTKNYNGMAVSAPIILKKVYSRDAFVSALIDTGLYKPTSTERAMYDARANWVQSYAFGPIIIDHTPQGVKYRNTMSGENLGPSNTLDLNDILFRAHSTESEFNECIQELLSKK